MNRRLALLFLLASTPIAAYGQGVLVRDSVTTSATNVPVGAQAPVLTVPGALVRVCADFFCVSPVAIYSDVALTQPINQPGVADGQGHFAYYVAPGTYYEQYATPSGLVTDTHQISVGLGGGGASVTFPASGSIVKSQGPTSQPTSATQQDLLNLIGPALAKSVNGQAPDSTGNITLGQDNNPCPNGSVYTVGSQPVVGSSIAMIDANGNAAPGASITVNTAASYIGVFTSSAQPGTQVCVQQGGIATVNFSNIPTIGSVAMTQNGSAAALNTGADSLASSSPRMPVVGTVISVSGSTALVQLGGLGVFGSGNFLLDNSNIQRNLSYAGLNMLTENAAQENGVYQVAGYASGVVNGYAPSTMATLGTGDGTTTTFSFPVFGVLASAFRTYVNGSIVTNYTTSANTWTFATAPASGAAIQIFADPYDLARAAADAAVTTTGRGQVVVLMPGVNWTCNDAPFPQGINSSTTSLVGWGHYTSFLQKRTICGVASATLNQPETSAGAKTGLYQGFTVNASGIDTDVIDVFSMQRVTFSDVLAEAPGGTGQCWTIGGPDNSGWTYNFYGYGIKCFERTQHAGKNNNFTLAWSNGQLQSATYNDVYAGQGNANDSYSQYTQLQFSGSGLATCTIQPQATPTFVATGAASQTELGLTFNYANLGNATIVNPGQCSDTAHIFLGPYDARVSYGVNLQNVTDSFFYDTEAYGAFLKSGIRTSNISSNNHFIGWHTWSGEYACFNDAGSGNLWTDGECDSPAGFGQIIDGPNGSSKGMTINEDTAAYQGVTGIYYRNLDATPANGWNISDLVCTNSSLASSDPYYVPFSNQSGGLSASNPVNAGISMTNIGVCNGSASKYYSLTYYAKLDSVNAVTGDGANFGYYTGSGAWFGPTYTLSTSIGMHPDLPDSMLFLRNILAGGGASPDPDGFGIDPLGHVALSVPIHGTVASVQLANPAAPKVNSVGIAGTSNYAYACVAADGNGFLTAVGASGSTATGNATLSNSNYNTVQCPFTEGFKALNVCRLTNDPGLSQGYIGQITKSTFEKTTGNFLKDTGQTANVSPAYCPAVNSTGQIVTALPSGGSVSLTPTTEVVTGATPSLSGTTAVSNFAPTANVTSFSIATCGYDGQRKVWHITSGATAYTLPASAPTNVRNWTAPTLTANKDTDIPFDCFVGEGIWAAGTPKTY